MCVLRLRRPQVGMWESRRSADNSIFHIPQNQLGVIFYYLSFLFLFINYRKKQRIPVFTIPGSSSSGGGHSSCHDYHRCCGDREQPRPTIQPSPCTTAATGHRTAENKIVILDYVCWDQFCIKWFHIGLIVLANIFTNEIKSDFFVNLDSYFTKKDIYSLLRSDAVVFIILRWLNLS